MSKFLKSLPVKWLLRLAMVFFRVIEVKNSDRRKIFHKLWTSVWLEEGYAHTNEPLSKIEEHYAIFDGYSTDVILYFLVWPIGTMRLIRDNGDVGIPVLNDFEITHEIVRPLVELTLLTVKRQWRGLMHLPSLVLWRYGYRTAVVKGTQEIVMAADWRLFHLLKRIFPFREVGPKKFYEGSDTIPAALDLGQAKVVLAQKNPVLLRFFTGN